MKELIKVIAFDADDTLWSNEPFFQESGKTVYGFAETVWHLQRNLSRLIPNRNE